MPALGATRSSPRSEVSPTSGQPPLFRRDGCGLALTKGGEALRERAAALLQGFETLRDEMRGLKGQVSGAASIGLPWLLLERLSAGLARRFIPAHPAVSIRFIGGCADHLQDAMLSGEADLALIFDPAPARATPSASGWRRWRCAMASRSMCASRSRRWRRRRRW